MHSKTMLSAFACALECMAQQPKTAGQRSHWGLLCMFCELKIPSRLSLGLTWDTEQDCLETKERTAQMQNPNSQILYNNMKGSIDFLKHKIIIATTYSST